MTDDQQLTPTDRQLLAREVAADKTTNPTGYEAYRNIKRQAFIAGWDAAMEYVRLEREQEQAAIIYRGEVL